MRLVILFASGLHARRRGGVAELFNGRPVGLEGGLRPGVVHGRRRDAPHPGGRRRNRPPTSCAGADQTEFVRFKNFELQAVVRAERTRTGGSSCMPITSCGTRPGTSAKGYEVQLNSTDKEKRGDRVHHAIVDLAESPR